MKTDPAGQICTYVRHNTEQEIDLYLQNSFFNDELGNTMVLALSNVLSVPVVEFSSMIHCPVFTVNPRQMAKGRELIT